MNGKTGGTPESVRARRLREIVASLSKAEGEWVQLSTLLGRVAYQTGASIDTVTDYFRTLKMAGLAQVDWKKDRVRLVGAVRPTEHIDRDMRESKREKKDRKIPAHKAKVRK